MYQSAHHTKCLSEMNKISKSYTLETFNGRNFPGSSKDKSLTTNKHPKITTDPLKDWRHEALLQKVTQWLCEGRRASAPKWLMFFFVGGATYFLAAKSQKTTLMEPWKFIFFCWGGFFVGFVAFQNISYEALSCGVETCKAPRTCWTWSTWGRAEEISP